jgi:cytochrome o ubiquinol oxidase subunit 2
LAGCDFALMNPKGQVGVDIKGIILIATWLMLLVVVPVIILTLRVRGKYRASNSRMIRLVALHPHRSGGLADPLLIIIALGIITWKSSHDLDPYKPLESNVKPVRWKPWR